MPVRSVSLKFCIDTNQLESAIDLGFIPDVTDYDNLSHTVLRIFLDQKVEESKTITTVSDIEALIEKKLRIDMSI